VIIALAVGGGSLVTLLIVLISRWREARATFAPLVSDEARGLAKRLDDVEDDVANLDRRFMRLRGQVTGSLRRMYDDDFEEPEEEPDAG
jgi:hypothetical protein